MVCNSHENTLLASRGCQYNKSISSLYALENIETRQMVSWLPAVKTQHLRCDTEHDLITQFDNETRLV